MGRFAFPPLAVAVADAGGLGQISVSELADPSRVATMLDETRQKTTGVIGAHLLGPDAESEEDRDFIRVAASRAGGGLLLSRS
jgi:hypothetical protein